MMSESCVKYQFAGSADLLTDDVRHGIVPEHDEPVM